MGAQAELLILLDRNDMIARIRIQDTSTDPPTDIDSATTKALTLEHLNGKEVAGVTWPVIFISQGGGVWTVSISRTISAQETGSVRPGDELVAIVNFDGGAGKRLYQRKAVRVKERN